MGKPRVMFLDIEATNLDANFGYCLCISWKWEGKATVHTLSIADSPTFDKDPTSDKYILRKFRDVAEEADIVVFHYGERFDWPYLQTRLLFHGLQPLANPKFIDTWRIARNRLKLNSNRLASIAALVGAGNKTALSGPIWIKAMAGHKGSIDYVVRHCVQDVRVLEQVYHKLAPLRTDVPRVSHTGCPTCGSGNVQLRGYAVTVKRKTRRMQCQDCGHWFNVPGPKDNP